MNIPLYNAVNTFEEKVKTYMQARLNEVKTQCPEMEFIGCKVELTDDQVDCVTLIYHVPDDNKEPKS
jgi:hypothetical protein